MADILVVLEVRDGKVRPASLQALGAARGLADARGGRVLALATEAVEPDLEALGGAGADEVLVAGAEAHSPDGAAATAVRVAGEEGADLVLLAATIRGRDLCGRIAAGLEAGFAPDCTALEADGEGLLFERPVYAGKARMQVRIRTPKAVASLRPNFFQPAGRSHSATRRDVPAEEGKARVVEMKGRQEGRPDVAEARIIVSGGRGLGGPENWPLLEALADALPGAALGASRAVVDAGWRPHSEQVGQTGKTVSPELYIAVGISGAIQHLAGMSTSKVIVAINKDAEAPIFQHATYGVVGDALEILPKLTEALKAAQAG